jgi:hypothetical protein
VNWKIPVPLVVVPFCPAKVDPLTVTLKLVPLTNGSPPVKNKVTKAEPSGKQV